jgi:translation elongation factor P/translation initiation factor 5A
MTTSPNQTNSYLEGYRDMDRLPETMRSGLFDTEQVTGQDITINDVIVLPGSNIQSYSTKELAPYTVKTIAHVSPGKHGGARNTVQCVNQVSGIIQLTVWVSSTIIYKPIFIKGVVAIVDRSGNQTWTGMVVDTTNPDVIGYSESMSIDVRELEKSSRKTINRDEFNFQVWGGCLTFTSRNKNQSD